MYAVIGLYEFLRERFIRDAVQSSDLTQQARIWKLRHTQLEPAQCAETEGQPASGRSGHRFTLTPLPLLAQGGDKAADFPVENRALFARCHGCRHGRRVW